MENPIKNNFDSVSPMGGIPKDIAQLQVEKICDGLISRIREAVIRAGGCIGTFYMNKGKHHTDDATEEEYMDSPIVVVHDSDISFYGNYEAATLYDLFLKGDKNVYCTLNGECGEDFDVPLSEVQTEGLINIVQWLKEHGFLPVMEKPECVCKECGSPEIQTQAWIKPNEGNAYVEDMGADNPGNNWCDECEGHNRFCTLNEFKERMDDWWNSIEPSQKERIANLHRQDFPPENGCQEFTDACKQWWLAKEYDEKRMIWKEYKEE